MKRFFRPKIKATRILNSKKNFKMRACFRMIRISIMKKRVNEVYLRKLKTKVINALINN
jgi:hypothetical protein